MQLVRQKSTAENPEDQTFEQTIMDINYKGDKEVLQKRKAHFTMNITKAYPTLFDAGSIAMQKCMMEHPDYETKIKNDPIALLKAI